MLSSIQEAIKSGAPAHFIPSYPSSSLRETGLICILSAAPSYQCQLHYLLKNLDSEVQLFFSQIPVYFRSNIGKLLTSPWILFKYFDTINTQVSLRLEERHHYLTFPPNSMEQFLRLAPPDMYYNSSWQNFDKMGNTWVWYHSHCYEV